MDNSVLQVKHVRDIIDIWDVMFPEQTRGEKQLALLTKAYYSRLIDNGVTPSQLTFLAGKVTDHCNFFPKIADILKARTTYGAYQQPSDSLQIEDSSSYHDPTPEERKQFKDRINAINDMIHEGTPMEETLKIVSQKIESFGEGS